MNYKRTIKNNSTKERFTLEVSYVPKEVESLEFKFSNNLYLLEKNVLKFFDGETALYPDTIISIRPKQMEENVVLISKENPFIYLVEGSFEDEGPFIRLRLQSVEYLFEQGKEYSIELGNDENRSNREVFKIE